MDRGAPFDAFGMDFPARASAALPMAARQILLQLAMLLSGCVNPGIDSLGASAHARIVGELHRQTPGDLLGRPTLLQLFDHPIDQPVTQHPVGLMGMGTTGVGLQLGLSAQI